jgi:hypothetical protein
MALANLAVLLIIGACAAYQYFKGTFVKALAALMMAICASIAAFGYFELLAGVFVGKGSNSRFPALVPWAQPLSFVLIFIVAFAIFQTIVGQLGRKKIDLGLMPERIGRVLCGIFLGLVLSGLVLTTLAMAPLPSKYPYPRFDEAMPDAENPAKAMLSPDGFVTGWFTIVSKGSLSGKSSFGVLHPDFIDQAFLNRHEASAGVSITTSVQAIELPQKQAGQEKRLAAWPAPAGLKDQNTRAIPGKSGHRLIIVRVGIKRQALNDAGTFTASQLRLICKPKGSTENQLAGEARNVWPKGYLEAEGQLRVTKLNERIDVTSSDFKDRDRVRYIDFAFYLPDGFVPVLIEFKQNTLVDVPPLAGAKEAPPAVLFSPKAATNKK